MSKQLGNTMYWLMFPSLNIKLDATAAIEYQHSRLVGRTLSVPDYSTFIPVDIATEAEFEQLYADGRYGYLFDGIKWLRYRPGLVQSTRMGDRLYPEQRYFRGHPVKKQEIPILAMKMYAETYQLSLRLNATKHRKALIQVLNKEST
jgi:hypothetical protein